MSAESVSRAFEPEFFDDRAIAQRTGMSRVWFQQARASGDGPPYFRCGRRRLYRWSEVVAWLESHRDSGKVSR